jgi:hypothetical protein
MSEQLRDIAWGLNYKFIEFIGSLLYASNENICSPELLDLMHG